MLWKSHSFGALSNELSLIVRSLDSSSPTQRSKSFSIPNRRKGSRRRGAHLLEGRRDPRRRNLRRRRRQRQPPPHRETQSTQRPHRTQNATSLSLSLSEEESTRPLASKRASGRFAEVRAWGPFRLGLAVTRVSVCVCVTRGALGIARLKSLRSLCSLSKLPPRKALSKACLAVSRKGRRRQCSLKWLALSERWTQFGGKLR